MLYRNDPMVQDTSCIIFDEIHYMNNRERGPVYEEILILLPSNVSIMFASKYYSCTFGYYVRLVYRNHFRYPPSHSLLLIPDRASLPLSDHFQCHGFC